MAEIIPAIIPKNFEDLEEKMSNVARLVPTAHIDVLDGSLAPLRSWPYARTPQKNADTTQTHAEKDADFDDIITEKKGFPFWQELEFEAHFMVRGPERIISDWIAAGASRIIVQIEGVMAADVRGLDGTRIYADIARQFEKSVEAVAGRVPLGAALALDTPNQALELIANDISIIQCMGWELSHLGRQGVPSDERVFDKIRQLRQKYPEHIIAVDGGVNRENISKLLEAGAKRFVIGSALWRGGSVRENFEKFKGLAR